MAEAATFFIGDDGWLVHNAGGCFITPKGRRFNLDPDHQKVFIDRNFTLEDIDEIMDNPTDVLIQPTDFSEVFAKKTTSGYAVVITGAGDKNFIVTAIRYSQKEFRNAIKSGKFVPKDPFE